MQSTLAMLMGAVFLLILIACANVASLLLARASGRKRETALRLALGCDRVRLLAQSLVESSILSILGAAGGIALAFWGLAMLRSVYFERLTFFAMPGLDRIELDWRVLAFTLASVILSTALFGSSSAISAWRLALDQSLRSGGRGAAQEAHSDSDRRWWSRQVALALLLLVGAGLLSKSFLQLMNVKLGFQAEHRTTATLTLPALQYRTLQQAARFYDSVIDRVASMPGVQSVAVTDILPLSGNDNRSGVQLQGYDPKPGERIRMHPRLVTPGYLETMGIPVLAGRVFSASDAPKKGMWPWSARSPRTGTGPMKAHWASDSDSPSMAHRGSKSLGWSDPFTTGLRTGNRHRTSICTSGSTNSGLCRRVSLSSSRAVWTHRRWDPASGKPSHRSTGRCRSPIFALWTRSWTTQRWRGGSSFFW